MEIRKDQPINHRAREAFPEPLYVRRFDLIGVVVGFMTFISVVTLVTIVPAIMNGFLPGLFISAICIVYMLIQRRKIVKVLNASGVETRGGKSYSWSDLKAMKNVRVVIVATSELLRVDLVFDSRKAVVPVKLMPDVYAILQGTPMRST